jgi:hypothetical protein
MPVTVSAPGGGRQKGSPRGQKSLKAVVLLCFSFISFLVKWYSKLNTGPSKP